MISSVQADACAMYHFHETTIITATTMTMTTTTTVVLFIISILLRIARSSSDDPTSPSSSSTPDAFNETTTVFLTVNDGNSTVDEDGGTIGGHVFDSGTLLRTLYVFVGVALIVGAYFVVRSLLLRCRKNRKTKYGLLATNDDTVEMRHLEEDEEEDAMVFDRTQSNSHRR